MSQITVTLSETQRVKLEEKAERLGLSPSALILLSLEEVLARPDDDFQKISAYILRKNADLYRRLA